MNIASRFLEIAAAIPHQTALVAGSRTYTFADLADRIERFAAGLAAAGWQRGMRSLVMVPLGADFFAMVYAHFKLGVVPVLIDPTMGFAGMGRAIAQAAPDAFVGIPRTHLARVIGGWGRASIRHLASVGWPWPGAQLLNLRTSGVPTAATLENETAAILFTSGSTGAPKGVLHTHGSFEVQTDFVRDQFDVSPGDVHVAAFPVFALYSLALGAKVVLPNADLSRPANVPPILVVEAVQKHQATCLFGSPALLANLGRHGERMRGLKAIISASGPVLPDVLERLDRLVDQETHIYVPYGATEGLPISLINHREALSLAPEWATGAGLCIGNPLDSVQLTIIPISDAPIANWSDVQPLPTGAVGEIAVTGPIISTAYLEGGQANRMAKIVDGERIWHRMGDLGKLDEAGRLWFYGRKNHRVGAHYTLSSEAIFLQHPHVLRAALVGVEGQPVMCIQTEPGKHSAALARELLDWAAQFPHTRNIRQVLFRLDFPMDIRHNSKINREALAQWAARELA